MLGTRAAAFAGKISNLRESVLRVQNGALPQPTCTDLANMMKYFSQVLHEFRDYKNIENLPLYAHEKQDHVQLVKTLPNFDYPGLYQALMGLVDILPLIPQTANGFEQLGANLLLLFRSLVPFLDRNNMETMPYLIATLFMSLPSSLHKDVLDTLCFNLLPFTMDQRYKATKFKVANSAQDRSSNARGKTAIRSAAQRQAIERARKTPRCRSDSASTSNSKNERKPPVHCIVRIEESGEPVASTSMGLVSAAAAAGRQRIVSTTSSSTARRFESLDERDTGCIDEFNENAEEADEDADEMVSEGYASRADEVTDTDDTKDDDDYVSISVTSILMIAFHYITEPAHHSQLIECLMRLKSNIFDDLLFVIAYGTTRARCPAVEILFRYWPDIRPNQKDRKNNIQSVGKSKQMSEIKHTPWQATKCQNKSCTATLLGDDEAVKMCLDFKISMTFGSIPPPMLVCLECAHAICNNQATAHVPTTHSSPPGTVTAGSVTTEPQHASGRTVASQSIDQDLSDKFIDILLPMEDISNKCENKKCRSSDKRAIGTCFDIECANYNCKKPIRYCRSCYTSTHEPCEANNYDSTLQSHIRHSSSELTIMHNEESIHNFVEAIISLLKEAAPADRPSKDSERYQRSLMGPMSQHTGDNNTSNIATEEKQLTSQYGIWLMTGLCESVDSICDELLGRLLGMLFQWFHFTACLPDDQAGSALEKLKGECIKGWIMKVKDKRLDVFVSCLLPHPIDCSKIGGHWEVWPDTAHQIKEGFKRLLCLVPYDIITNEVWDEIMPYWMECFRHEVPENELNELKILLSKVFDPELSPLGFETKQMYNFISTRFEISDSLNQEQTLCWLQIITMLEIPIPIDFLFQMLKSGVSSLAKIRKDDIAKLRCAKQMAEHIDKLPTELSSSLSISSHGDADKAGERRAGSSASESMDEDLDVDDEDECYDDDDDDDDDDDADDADDHSSDRTRRTVQTSFSVPMNEDDPPKVASGTMQVSKPLTHQEKQAQARAAFSARILQQASLLDAQQSTGMSQSATTSHLKAIASDASGPSALQQKSSSAQVLTVDSESRQPLKSTSGTMQSDVTDNSKQLRARRHRRRGRRKARNDDESKQKRTKPKLKLHLSMVDDDESLTDVDNNLVCYILMMDILLKQLDLQEINSHKGLDGREAHQAIELLNMIISTPWVGQHTCCDSLSVQQQSTPRSGEQKTAQQNPNNLGANLPTEQQAHKPQNAPSTTLPSSESMSSNIHAYGHCAEGFEREDSYESCVFCEIISTFHQLAMSLIEYFSPVIEVSICEVSQDAANGEFDGRPDYSRIGLDHLGPSPRIMDEASFTFVNLPSPLQQQYTNTATGGQPSVQVDPLASPFSPSYMGPSLKPDVLNALPVELQLTYNLLVQFHQYQTPDIVSQLLQMIKLISLHSQVLSKAARTTPQFITWCQHNMLVSKLWYLCELESSEIARTCVPLLLHCITLPWGVRLFRDIVERDFNSDKWLSRFRAVERVVTIAYFCEPSTIKNSTLLQSTMASAFCYVVRCLDDIEAIVAQRALVSLEMMKTSSLKLLLWCLEVQFDYIIIDRPMILRSVFQLYNHLKDRRFLTWDFFLNRFDTIFLEAQIFLQQTGEIPSFTMQDLKNTNTKSEIYQKKISRAKEALQETHHSRSLSQRFNELKFSTGSHNSATQSKSNEDNKDNTQQTYRQSIQLQQQIEVNVPATLAKSTGGGDDDENVKSAQETRLGASRSAADAVSPLKRVMQHGRSISSRYQSVAFLTSQSIAGRKNSRFMQNLAMQSVPPLMSAIPDKLHQHLPNSFVDDGNKLNEIAQENHVFGVVHRICDEDRDTNHSLVFLLMQFFSKPDPSHPQSIKALNRSHQIVLRHLNILMGFSIARKNFLIASSNLRLLPTFNAFLTSLPKVLDFNYSLGQILLDTCLPVLIYCPAPDGTQFDRVKTPAYSLWLLNPLLRQSWLMSVMTFLYKYQFGQPHLKEYVNMLVWIVINTLESHLNCITLDSPLTDRYLVNVRDSNVTQDTISTHETTNQQVATADASTHSKAQATSSHETTHSLAATILTGSKDKFDSPAKPHQHPHPQHAIKSDTIELSMMHPRSDSHAKIPTSPSGGSLRQPLAAATAVDMSSVTQSPSASQAQQLRTATTSLVSKSGVAATSIKTTMTSSAPVAPLPGAKQLIKADTSDNLNVKAKLFQRKSAQQDSSSPHKLDRSQTSSTGSSTVRIDMEPLVKPMGGPRATIAFGGPGDERLLPIGGGSGCQRARSHANLPATERLLPIGSSASSTIGRQQQPHQQEHWTQTEPMRSSIMIEEVTEQSAPVLQASAHTHDSDRDTVMSPTSPPPISASSASSAKNSPIDTPTASADSTHVSSVYKPPSHKQKFVAGKQSVYMIGESTSSGSDVRNLGNGAQPAATATVATHDNIESTRSNAGSSPIVQSKLNQRAVGAKATKSVPTSSKIAAQRDAINPKQVQSSFSSPSLLNDQLAHINRHSIIQEFSDKDLSMCLVILETFIHHEPSMAAQMLPNILRLVARYSSSTNDSQQTGMSANSVGGSTYVARQFIRVALHDLMDNNIFQQIFTSHFTNYEFYKSMATALADFADLNQLAPLSRLFEDLSKQKSLPRLAQLITMLENVATYLECVISESTSHSQSTWNNFINNWEAFLRKLTLTLPRNAGMMAPYGASSPTIVHVRAGIASSLQGANAGTTSGVAAVSGTSALSPTHAGSPDNVAAGKVGATSSASNDAGSAQASPFLPGSGGGARSQDAGNAMQGGASAASGASTQASSNTAASDNVAYSQIMASIVRIILSTTKISHLASCKTIVDPYSKMMSFTVVNCPFKFEHLLEVTHNCARLYTRDRERHVIQRTIIYELMQVLKFRFFIREENILLLLQYILQDVGGTLSPKVICDSLKIEQSTLMQPESFVTNAGECMRQYMGDLLEFITDVHAISRINDNLVGSQPSSINRDSFGGHVKAAISQYMALELSLSNGPEGNRQQLPRYLPWLYAQQNTNTTQNQGGREFIDSVSHIRQLSWILLGALQHATLTRSGGAHCLASQSGVGASGATATSLAAPGAGTSGNVPGSSSPNTGAGASLGPGVNTGAGVDGASGAANSTSSSINCQPIPIERNSLVAEHVHIILAGFAEQSKQSVMHMSGLFHAFLLCQLWTMYCENISHLHPVASEQYQICQSTIDDFWAKVTPGILRLVGHSRVMSEMVSSHFLQLIESLIESNSSVLIRYLPMWNQVFYSYKRRNKSGNLAVRLQKCVEWQPSDLSEDTAGQNNLRLINWLEKVQYKMSHIEIQSSQAAPFYLN